MNPIDLTPGQLRKAANIQEKIQSLQKELNQLLGASAAITEAAPKPKRGKWKMGAAGRARIAAAAKARWAKIKAAKGATKSAQNPKIHRSAAWRAAVSAAAKARWKKAKAAGKSKW
jgi:hypothetical protein